MIRLADVFYLIASDHLNPELARQILNDLEENLPEPTMADLMDLQTLIKRAARSLINKDFGLFTRAMKTIRTMAGKIKLAGLDQDFQEFISDQDLWNWVENLDLDKLGKNDYALMSIVRDDLLFLSSKSSLIAK